MLDDLGFDETVLLVYRLVLRGDGTTPEVIAGRLGLALGEVTSALETLQRFHMIWNCDEDETIRPANPESGLSAVIAAREAEVLRQQQQVQNARAYIEGLAAEYAESRVSHPRGTLEVLTCPDHTRRRILELTAAMTDEILGIVPGNRIGEYAELVAGWHGPPEGRPPPVRCVFHDSVIKHPERRRHMQILIQSGASVRTIATVPEALLVAGARGAVLQPEAEPGVDSIVVHDRVLMTVLRDYFERVWQQAAPMGGAAAVSHGDSRAVLPLSPAEHAALGMLSEGMTDEAIARKLDVSVRTVRRVIAQVMRTMGARSRFELAVLAAKRGLL